MKKRMLTSLLSLALILTLLPVSALAAGERSVMSGNCGAPITEGGEVTDKVKWSYADGTLTISGTGAMADYGTKETPWYTVRESITNIELSDGLTHIGKSAFLQTKITDVTIPDTVTSIGPNAFWNCNTIRATVPASVTEIGETAFFGTFEITIDSENPNYTAEDNVIYNKDKTVLIQCSQGKAGEFIIPDTVTDIAAFALYNCTNLTGTLALPEEYTVIKNSAFYGTGFTSVQFGSQVTEIEQHAFSRSSLTGKLELPSSLTTVKEGAFQACTKITEVNIPESVTMIEYAAFSDLEAAKKVTVPLASINYDKKNYVKHYIFSSYSKEQGVGNLKTVVLGVAPEDVGGTELFSASLEELQVLVLGTGVSKISDWAIHSTSFQNGLYPSALEIGNGNDVFTNKATKYTVADISSMAYGDTQTMLTFETPSGQTCPTVTYASSDPSVITVNGNGKMTPVNSGEARITAMYDGVVFADLNVTVDPIPVTGVTLDQTTLALTVGKDATLAAAVTPDNATNQTVTWSSSDDSIATVDANGNVTAVAAGEATITVTTEDGNYADTCTVTVEPAPVVVPSYTVKMDEMSNGTVTASRQTAPEGRIITLTVTPDEGYKLASITVTSATGKELTLTDKGDGKYTFVMPGSKVTVSTTFTSDGTGTEQPLPFVDVDKDAYYYEAVKWAVENGVTEGTSATTFSSNGTCTRAQIVTFLWRAAGCPEPVGNASKFTDVEPGSFYEKAVAWAIEQGITLGTSETTFSPHDTCIRAQIATFLWRYSGKPTATGDTFADVPADAYYAEAVAWAVENAITIGTSETTFSPYAPSLRAQAVTMIYRSAAE